MKKLYGVTVAMVTPMDENQKPNYSEIADLTEKLVNRGVHCLYPCGTTGEMLRLTIDERKAVAETVIKAAKGRVNVFVHVGAANADQTLELARHAMQTGADGVGVVTPQFFGCNVREITAYYDEIAEGMPENFPIYMYSIPQCAANDIIPEVAKNLYERHHNIVGMKYSFLDMNRTSEYIDIDPEFSVLHGCDRMFTSMLILGCDGTVSGISGVVPEPFVNVYNAYTSGDIAEAQKWQKACREICDILKCGSNMAYFKSGLEYRGVKGGHMRKPQLDLTDAERENLHSQMDKFFAAYKLDKKI